MMSSGFLVLMCFRPSPWHRSHLASSESLRNLALLPWRSRAKDLTIGSWHRWHLSPTTDSSAGCAADWASAFGFGPPPESAATATAAATIRSAATALAAADKESVPSRCSGTAEASRHRGNKWLALKNRERIASPPKGEGVDWAKQGLSRARSIGLTKMSLGADSRRGMVVLMR